MAEKEAAKYRPYRIGAYAVYLVIAIGFSLAITVNVVRSTLAMTPDHPAPSTVPLGKTECLSIAKTLWTELDGRRKAMSEAPSVRAVDVGWTKFRIDWLIRARDAESRCVQGEQAEVQKKIYGQLEKLMDLYTTHAVQFAGEVGPTIDSINADFNQANK